MSILILHRNPFEPFPYDNWLAGYDGDVVILAARDKIELFAEEVPTGNLGYTHLEIMDRFDDELVVKRALELATEFEITRIIAHHEADVDSAAWLREHLGLTGAWTADVLPFRDKALMKQLVTAAGIEVAAHAVPRTIDEARAFAAEYGFPLVFKDRAGYNAVGLRILRTDDALDDCLRQAYANGPREDVLLEAFVPGRMCHVDGLVVDGRPVLSWPSQYQYDLASFGSDPGARVDLTLDPDDPLTDRLLAMTDQILTALKPADSRLLDHGFHAEIFHTPDDRLVLCEIASRPAGAKVREVFDTMFGINLGEYVTRVQAGLPLPALADTLAGGARPLPRRMSGQMLTMKRPGLVRSVPSTPAEPWVERFWVYAKQGDVISPAAGSSDFLTAVVGSAPTRAECHRRLRELGERFVAQIDIVEES
jgi:Carbamoyl-phosphate synthase L chain, ATP binding domain